MTTFSDPRKAQAAILAALLALSAALWALTRLAFAGPTVGRRLLATPGTLPRRIACLRLLAALSTPVLCARFPLARRIAELAGEVSDFDKMPAKRGQKA